MPLSLRHLLLPLLLLAATAEASVVAVSDTEFDATVLEGGKNAFVKFYAPWCGHCKSLKPDWDKLGKEFKGSPAVVIVDVDCTAGGQAICKRMGVKGYPTLKYFTEKTGKKGADYDGGRDLSSLKKFVTDKLSTPPCNAQTLKGCAPNEITFIEKSKDKTPEEINMEISEKTEELKTLKKDQRAAEADLAEKQQQWKKREAVLSKALGLLKQLAKGSAASK